MVAILLTIFFLGYLGIILEHSLAIDKTALALLMGSLCWATIALIQPQAQFFLAEGYRAFAATLPGLSGRGLYRAFVEHELAHHLVEAAQILFFLLGAMVVVDLIDAHQGFALLTRRIQTRSGTRLLWIVGGTTFFLSALLDNLTSSIVMVTLVRQLVEDKRLRRLFAGAVVVAANAGGAWSPVGDVTTTMLWIGGQITAWPTITHLLLPSLVAAAVPLALLSGQVRGKMAPLAPRPVEGPAVSSQEQSVMFYTGVAALVGVPIFKAVTHLPPFVGMLLALGLVWAVSQILHSGKDEEAREPFMPASALARIDASSVLFFLGILLAIGALESMHLLAELSAWLSAQVPSQTATVYLIGLASSVIDNVPLVAATIGMYPLKHYPTDSPLWQMLAYASGTGGSILIIGSAAGVAVMSLERLDFLYYLTRIGWMALLGYTAGLGVYVLLG